MRVMMVVVAAAAAFGLASAPALAAPALSEQTVFYDISGSTMKDLVDELRRKGPLDADGKRYDADTRWSIKWNYRYQPRGNACRLNTVHVSAEIKYVMPRLADSARVPADLRQRWNSYVGNLKTHENGHGRHGSDAAREVEKALLALSRATCNGIAGDADTTAKQVIAKYNKLDIDYDAKTSHGATQGALFR